MIYLDEEKSKVLIFSGNIANKLLDKGHEIVQVRPDKRNKIKTVFIFAGDTTIEKDLLSCMDMIDCFE